MTWVPGAIGPVGVQHPFRLPSGTSLRFALLILSTSVAVGAQIATTTNVVRLFTFGGTSLGEFSEAIACRAREFPLHPADSEAVDLRCGSTNLLGGPAVELAALAVLWLGVGLVYWLLPAYRLRRRRLRPLRPDTYPGIHTTLTELLALAELRCRVRFVVDLGDQRLTGTAFGRVGRRQVMLAGGLLRLHETDREAFRAVVLHELAHLRNRDVDIAFLTLICHRLFVFTVAIPLAVTSLPSVLVGWLLFPSGVPFHLLFLAAQVALAVTTTRTAGAVLRSRELHADARVGLWTGGAHALRRLLIAQHGKESAAPSRRRLLRTHPSAAKRLAALGHTSLLFRFSAWDAFGLALTCSLVYVQVAGRTSDATGLTGAGAGTGEDVLGALLPAVMLGGSVAAGIWRATLASHLDHTRWTGAHRIGLAVGGGLAVGSLGDERQATALSLGIADPLSVQLSWRLLLLAAGYAFVRWNAVTARTWTPAVLAARRPLVPVAFCTVLGVALLSVWLGHVYPSGTPGFQMLPPLPGPLRFLPSPLDYLGFVFSLTAVSTPPALLLAVVATTAALPLAAPLGARLAHRAPRPTLYLDGPGRFLLWPPTPEQSARLLALPGLRPVRAVATGLVLGTAAALALWLAHVVSAVMIPAPIERLGGAFALYIVPVAILLPLAIGFFVGRRAARHELRALHGVLAALGAGLPVPAAAFTARDHFACVRWGLDHPACEVVQPLAGMSAVTLTITAWTALLALLLLPAWATAYDAVRQRTTRGQSSP